MLAFSGAAALRYCGTARITIANCYDEPGSSRLRPLQRAVSRRCVSTSCGEDLDVSLQCLAKPILLDLEVIPHLQVKPEALGRAEEAREAESGVGCDGALAVHDLVDSTRGHADSAGKSVLTDAEGFDELLKEDLARVNRWELVSGHGKLLVVVHDLDLFSVARVPSEADTPLIVHADAVLTLSIASGLLESVTRGDPQVIKGFRRVEEKQFSKRGSLDVG
jgi:hypothetical protein